MIGKGLPLYRIERCILETDELFDDGSHILYVNGAYRDDTPLGKLMHDFSCTQPSDMNYGILAERARYFKESKEGRNVLSMSMHMITRKFEQIKSTCVGCTDVADNNSHVNQ